MFLFCALFHSNVPFWCPFCACGTIGATAKRERAGSAEVGPCLTDAAPKAAPGELAVKVKPLREGPNVNLSGRCGMLFRWCHLHLIYSTCWAFSQHPSRRENDRPVNAEC